MMINDLRETYVYTWESNRWRNACFNYDFIHLFRWMSKFCRYSKHTEYTKCVCLPKLLFVKIWNPSISDHQFSASCTANNAFHSMFRGGFVCSSLVWLIIHDFHEALGAQLIFQAILPTLNSCCTAYYASSSPTSARKQNIEPII